MPRNGVYRCLNVPVLMCADSSAPWGQFAPVTPGPLRVDIANLVRPNTEKVPNQLRVRNCSGVLRHDTEMSLRI